MILDVALLIFAALELANVVVLYVQPEFRYANGVGVFDGWRAAQSDEGTRLYATYMVRWVANSKLIFVALLVAIVALGSDELKLAGAIVTMVASGAYFVALHPIIARLDRMGLIRPNGYARVLAGMVGGFIVMLAAAAIATAF